MISLAVGSKLVERVEELPDLRNAGKLFCDFETNSYTKKRGGDSPWHGDRICGIAIAKDDDPDVYYIPIRHQRHTLQDPNLPLEPVIAWLKEVIETAGEWINHNIKFDARFAYQDGIGRIDPVTLDSKLPTLSCTIVQSKLRWSDRLNYGLKELGREWLNETTDEKSRLAAFLDGIKSKNFADAPPDILGEYACKDVHMNRRLYWFNWNDMDDSVKSVWATEQKMTRVLLGIEITGMRIDPLATKIQKTLALHRMVGFSQELQDLLGCEFNPKSHDDVKDLLNNQWGIPVLARDPETKNATFDKKALPLYAAHSSVVFDKTRVRVMEIIAAYREEAQFKGLFCDSYLEKHVDGVLHPEYNQVVRTGRMSCSDPNSQQLNKRAKRLIICPPGMAFLSCDYSQIEYRLIIHYAEEEDAIRAYNEDPETDFHEWVAELVGVTRKGGKIINFGISFGMGQKKLTKSLASAKEIAESIGKLISELIAQGEITEGERTREYEFRCSKRAAEILSTYHAKLPGIKRMSRYAESVCKRRGFVFNAYGRRRYLPPKASYKAFNSVIQSCAADIMKERTVSLAPEFNAQMRAWGIRVMASVHDETLFVGPVEIMRRLDVRQYIKRMLEDTRVKFRVPIYTGMGYSEQHWAEASGDEGKLSADLMTYERDLPKKAA